MPNHERNARRFKARNREICRPCSNAIWRNKPSSLHNYAPRLSGGGIPNHRISRSERQRVDQRRQVTREGLEEIKAELADMIEVKRPAIIAAVAEARSHGDLRENAAYEAARHDQ